MKCENIDIKKLQQFAKIMNKLDWRKIEHEKIIKVDMTLQEFFERKEKHGHYFYKSVKIKDGGTQDKEHPNYLTQIVSVECKLNTKHAHNRMINFLGNVFDMDIEYNFRSPFYGFYHNTLRGICKHFAQNKNIKDFSRFSFEIKDISTGYLTCKKMLFINFTNSNFKLELEI